MHILTIIFNEFFNKISFFFIFEFRVMPFCSRFIAKSVIKLFSSLHAIDESFLSAIFLQIDKEIINGFHCNPEGGNWVNHAVVAILLECIDMDVRGLSKLCHVCQ